MKLQTKNIVSHWDEAWAEEETRIEWLTPDIRVSGIISSLRERGVRKILDLGCGVGRHALLFAASGFEVWALDGSEEGIEYLQKKAESLEIGLTTVLGDIHELPFPDSFFDYVLAWNVIYHGRSIELSRSIQEIKRILGYKSIFQCTLLSVNNINYGRGIALDNCSFIQPGRGEKSHPHCYTSKNDALSYLSGMRVHTMEQIECNPRPGSLHWHIVAEKTER
jgi:tellurite methyltransferase